ncbi:MAG: hypothetical protein GY702_25210 [Desulfobulbaceae bacterium]|nr:hypothetical protein [Desulfobulbaceae bacterium]
MNSSKSETVHIDFHDDNVACNDFVDDMHDNDNVEEHVDDEHGSPSSLSELDKEEGESVTRKSTRERKPREVFQAGFNMVRCEDHDWKEKGEFLYKCMLEFPAYQDLFAKLLVNVFT